MRTVSMKLNAINIKALLIDYLLSTSSEVVLGNEVMFGSKKGLVDIIQLLENKLYAYEIKGDNDDFRRLDIQIAEYKKVFDYVYVVVTNKYIEKVKFSLDKSIGILYVDNLDNIFLVKKATLQRQQDKLEILNSITAKFLKQHFKIKTKNNSSQLRYTLMQKKLPIIKQALYSALMAKISIRYNLFLAERGELTHEDDIPLLSLQNKIIV